MVRVHKQIQICVQAETHGYRSFARVLVPGMTRMSHEGSVGYLVQQPNTTVHFTNPFEVPGWFMNEFDQQGSKQQVGNHEQDQDAAGANSINHQSTINNQQNITKRHQLAINHLHLSNK